MDKMLEMPDKRRANLGESAPVTKDFYAQLTPSQQAVFDADAKFKGHGRAGYHPKS